jgi:hypothetical protein
MENGREPALTTVLLKNGKKLSRYAQRPKGTLQIPLSAKELDQKFEDCAPGRPASAACWTGWRASATSGR